MLKKVNLLLYFFLQFFIFNIKIVYSGATTSPQYKCLHIPQSTCVNDARTRIAKDNNPNGLVGWWTFDDRFATDQSGYRNDMINPPPAGPQFGGSGYSGNYNFSNYSTINHMEIYDTNEFSLTFWVYLLQDSVGVWRTIIHKGNILTEMTPTVQLWPNSNKVHVRVSTQASWNEGLDTNGALILGRWSHIAVIVTNQLLQVYLNGQPDNQIILKGPVVLNQGPFHIGGDPWHPGVGMFFDDLRFFRTAIKPDYLIAWVEPFIPVYNGNFYSILGCPTCNYYTAINTCPDGYQLCSINELYVGGYLTARIMGWFNNNNEIWVREDLNNLKMNDRKEYMDPNVYKMGICCQM